MNFSWLCDPLVEWLRVHQEIQLKLVSNTIICFLDILPIEVVISLSRCINYFRAYFRMSDVMCFGHISCQTLILIVYHSAFQGESNQFQGLTHISSNRWRINSRFGLSTWYTFYRGGSFSKTYSIFTYLRYTALTCNWTFWCNIVLFYINKSSNTNIE